MHVEILERKENPLLKRVEVTFKAVHKAEATPSRDVLRSELAKALNATKDVVVVDGAASTFGRYETHGYAKVYKSKELATAVERKYVLIRNRLAEPEAKPAEGAPKPEKPAPAPKKEEAKAEAKPQPRPEMKPEAKAEKAPPKAERALAKEPKKEEKKPAEKPEKAEKPAKAEPKKAEPKKKEGK